MSALYIHIPFCLSKCPYCSFVSEPGRNNLHKRYQAALLREAQQVAAKNPTTPLTTLFIGGGTPTILAGHELAAIIERCRNLFGFVEKIEITIEANPGSIDLDKLILLRQCGINRLSIGAQSFNDTELRHLGRIHSAKDAEIGVHLARMAGFTNINLDLMYGVPRQNSASWQQSLEKALSLAPTHLSLYELTVEHGTPFHEQLRCGQLDLPDEEEMAAMDQITAQLCHNNGFEQYEISNYARPGYQCRHNINYWQNGPYLAIGAGAVACVEGRRQRRINDPLRYCASIESNQSVIAEEERLDATASCRETVIMGLRMLQGVALEPLRQRYNMDVKTCYGTILTKLVEQGLLELTASHLRLTSTGLRFANQVMAELV